MKTMQAIKLTQPCRADELLPTTVPRPEVEPGYAVVKVKAFGVNESEVTSRKGGSDGDFSYPRILGIEGVGVVEEVTDESSLKVGQQVATMMGGLGRSIDGSYADYMLVKETNLIPFESNLPWDIIGAVPEMVQTAYGSLTIGLNLEKGDTLLIHGGTSTVGLTAAALAKTMGATVLSTSRKADKLAALTDYGVDFSVLDDSNFVTSVRVIAPDGVDKVLELVGTNVVPQDMSLLKKAGKLCFVGALNDHWTFENLSPYQIPFGKFFTSYAGGVADLPSPILNDMLQKIEKGELKLPIAKVYQGLAAVGQAKANLESGNYLGKHVIVV